MPCDPSVSLRRPRFMLSNSQRILSKLTARIYTVLPTDTSMRPATFTKSAKAPKISLFMKSKSDRRMGSTRCPIWQFKQMVHRGRKNAQFPTRRTPRHGKAFFLTVRARSKRSTVFRSSTLAKSTPSPRSRISIFIARSRRAAIVRDYLPANAPILAKATSRRRSAAATFSLIAQCTSPGGHRGRLSRV